MQGLTTNPSGSMVHVTPNATAGVKLFVKDGSGNRYYLRVNTQSSNVELVCQSHVDNVSCSTSPKLIESIYGDLTDFFSIRQVQYNPSIQELEFDLVTVDSNEV